MAEPWDTDIQKRGDNQPEEAVNSTQPIVNPSSGIEKDSPDTMEADDTLRHSDGFEEAGISEREADPVSDLLSHGDEAAISPGDNGTVESTEASKDSSVESSAIAIDAEDAEFGSSSKPSDMTGLADSGAVASHVAGHEFDEDSPPSPGDSTPFKGESLPAATLDDPNEEPLQPAMVTTSLVIHTAEPDVLDDTAASVESVAMTDEPIAVTDEPIAAADAGVDADTVREGPDVSPATTDAKPDDPRRDHDAALRIREERLATAREWSIIGEDSKIRIRASVHMEEREVGSSEPGKEEMELIRLVTRFKEYEQQFRDLADAVRSTEFKVSYLPRIQRMMTNLSTTAQALGDFDRLITGLLELETGVRSKIEENRARKEQLIEKAEALRESTDWRATTDRLRSLQMEWKLLPSAGKEIDSDTWKRFRSALDGFFARRQEHYDERAKELDEHRRLKEELCERAEALRDSTDWRATTDALKEMQAEWRRIGATGREYEEGLWLRFQAAQNVFFERRKQHYNEREREHKENRRKKEALCAEAETIADSTDWRETGEVMRRLLEEWKRVGPTGKDQEEALWKRFQAIRDRFFERRSSHFAERERQEADNLTRKEEICQRAEQLVSTEDAAAAAEEIKELQAEWKAVGHVPREKTEEIWSRFRKACDRIFAQSREERSIRQGEWRSQMREVATRKRDQATRLREAVIRDQDSIAQWKGIITTLRGGPRTDEICASLVNRIEEVEKKLKEKRERLEEIEGSIRELDTRAR